MKLDGETGGQMVVTAVLVLVVMYAVFHIAFARRFITGSTT